MSYKVILLGAVRDKLIANGYAPTSATSPGAALGHRIIDDPAAVLLTPTDDAGRSVLALTITVRDKAIRAAILAVFAKHGVGKGPVRISSDGSEQFIVRPPSSYSLVMSRVSKPAHGEQLPAVALDAKDYFDNRGGVVPPPSLIVRLSGNWPRGDLLTVARDALPTLDHEDRLFDEVARVLSAHEPKAVYTPPPPRELTKEEKAERAEEQRLEAELAKRTDEDVLAEVERRLMQLSTGGFSTPWERAARIKRAESPAGRIALYDTIVAERKEEQRRGPYYVHAR
jgi:hypothetical protein